MRVTR